MAFTGQATVTQVSDECVRITGLSLAAGASGTIACFGSSGAEVVLPAGFQPLPDDTLQDSVRTRIHATSSVATAIPIRVVKTGNKLLNFVITLTNDHASLASPNLEIYVETLA